MNLHELNEKPHPWGLVYPDGLADILRDYPLENYQRELLRYYRSHSDPLTLQAIEGDFRPAFRTVDVHTRGTREQNRDALAILRELDWQYARVREWRARPTDMQRVAFTITQEEWYVLRSSLDFYELQRHLGEQIEGAFPTYRGYPLVIR